MSFDNPSDSPIQRFSTFWLWLLLVALFGLVTLVLAPWLKDRKVQADPAAEARLELKDEVDSAQAPAKEKIAGSFKKVAATLSAKPQASAKAIPGAAPAAPAAAPASEAAPAPAPVQQPTAAAPEKKPVKTARPAKPGAENSGAKKKPAAVSVEQSAEVDAAKAERVARRKAKNLEKKKKALQQAKQQEAAPAPAPAQEESH